MNSLKTFLQETNSKQCRVYIYGKKFLGGTKIVLLFFIKKVHFFIKLPSYMIMDMMYILLHFISYLLIQYVIYRYIKRVCVYEKKGVEINRMYEEEVKF